MPILGFICIVIVLVALAKNPIKTLLALLLAFVAAVFFMILLKSVAISMIVLLIVFCACRFGNGFKQKIDE